VKREIRILLVEDNNYHALLMEREIEQRYPHSVVTIARSHHEAKQAMRSQGFDVAVVDLDMPDEDSVAFLRRLVDADPQLSVVVISSDNSETQAAEIYNAGASDLLVKDRSFHVVVPRLIGQVTGSDKIVTNRKRSRSGECDRELTRMIQITSGTLSHEINNPLMTILGVTELILDDEHQYETATIEKIKIVRDSARRIQGSLKRLSSISQPGIKRTASGNLIDLPRSRFATKAGF